jgi:hypothetical protein
VVAEAPPMLRSYGRAGRGRLPPLYIEKNQYSVKGVYDKYYFSITITHTASSLSVIKFDEITAQEKMERKNLKRLLHLFIVNS